MSNLHKKFAEAGLKVLLNNEVRAATPSMRTSSGVYWID